MEDSFSKESDSEEVTQKDPPDVWLDKELNKRRIKIQKAKLPKGMR